MMVTRGKCGWFWHPPIVVGGVGMTLVLKKVWLAAAVLALIVSTCAAPTVRAQTARQVAQSAFPSVVLLAMADANGQPVSLGSGFFVRSGVVATNLHVIEGAASGYAKRIGKEAKYDIAGTVGVDTRRDLVLLAVRATNSPSLPLGDSRLVQVGDKVYVVGSPLGLEGTFSQGIVSGVRQVSSDTLLQITAPISPGSSGGPVLDSQGKVIGVAVATFAGGQNLNFAIPVCYLVPLLADAKLVTRLSPRMPPKQDGSILNDFGGRNTEGVVGGQLTWDWVYGQTGNYTFSLRNRLQRPVKDVYCLLVFYDGDGTPIDFDVVGWPEVIPPGLAKRVHGNVDGSVQKLTTRCGSASPWAKVEFRILDFQILD